MGRCRMHFESMEALQRCSGAHALVRAGSLDRQLVGEPYSPRQGWPARAPAADQRIRPTIYANVRMWEILAAFGRIARPTRINSYAGNLLINGGTECAPGGQSARCRRRAMDPGARWTGRH